jgi:iron complex outermembrane receptor protein/vitamin B12 transporter
MARAHSPFRFHRVRTVLPLFAFAVVLVCGWPPPAAAQTPDAAVHGRVLDPLGAPVPGAAVTLVREGSRAADTVADAQGRYAFHGLGEGRYQIDVRANGFAHQLGDPVFVGADGDVVVDVTLAIGVEQQVVVTAAATEAPMSQVGASVSVIDRATLDTLAAPDALDAIRLVPGAAVVQSGGRGGLTSVFVRGGASTFTKVLVDGVPANDIGGAFDFGSVATTGLDRIEMLRNANSVLYGSDALAGVIDLTTRRGTSRVPEVTLGLDGGNFGTGREEASIGGAVRRIDYFVDYSHFDTDNDAPNSAYRNDTVAARFGWAVDSRSNVTVTVRHMDVGAGSPNAVGFYGIADDSTLDTDATYVSAALESHLSPRWQTLVRFASMDQGYHTVNPSPTGEPFDPFDSGFPNYLGHVVTLTGANGYSVTGQAILDYGGIYPTPYDADTSRRSVYGQATGHLANWLDLSAGARVDHESGSTIYAGGTPSATSRTNPGAFVEARVALGRAFVTGGVGYDHNAIFKSAVTPRISAAVYLRDPSAAGAFGDTKLTFNAGTGIKAPNIGQELSSLYALVRSLPGGGSSIGAAISPLGPERSRSVDVGVEQGLWHGRARIRASFFHNRFLDLLEYVSAGVLPELGIPPAVAEAAGAAYVNSSSYRARGVEVSGTIAAGPALQVTGSYTRLQAVVTDSFAASALAPAFNPEFPDVPIGAYGPLVGAPPFRHPANTGSLLVTFTRGPLRASLDGYFAGKADDSTFLSDGFFGNSLLLPNHDLDAAYQRIDASVAYRVLPRVTWYLRVENLRNQLEQGAFGYPALGRSARTGVTIALGGDASPRP